MNLKAYFKTIYKEIFSKHVKYLRRELKDCKKVLDLGCGSNSQLQHCRVPFSVGVEIFRPYLEESRRKKIHSKYIKADIRKIKLPIKSFDAVIATEVLEHLMKKDGYELIKNMEIWATKKIIISTPNSYLWQDGYDSNPWQEHKSGWSVEELSELGFRVSGINGLRSLRSYKSSIKYRPKILWQVISDLTQMITYHYPKLAFQLFAVKDIQNKEKQYGTK